MIPSSLRLFAINLGLFTVLRLAFFLVFRDHAIPAGDLARPPRL